MRKTITLLAALVVVMLGLTVMPFAGEPATKGGAQTAFDYEYEVLPGIQPGFISGRSSTYGPRDLKLTCGWHGACGGTLATDKARDGLDIGIAAGTSVFAGFRAVTHSDHLTAETFAVSTPDTTGCRFVEVVVRDSALNEVGRVRYLHVVPSVLIANKINLPSDDSGLAALALSPVGTIALAAWTKDPVTPALLTAAAGMYGLDQRETSFDDTLYNPGRKIRLLNLGTKLKPKILRQATLTRTTDGKRCPTSGPHLHQDSPQPPGGDTRNRNTSDATKGFPGPRGSLPAFCSDTWMFKFRSASGTPAASAVAACPTIAAPTGLYAAPGDTLLALAWNEVEPAADAGYAITGYEFRYKASTASDWPATWTPVSGTSHLLTGLTNGTGYDVELRAASDRFIRSATVTDSGTPKAGLVPTTCTVDVAVRDAGGHALGVDGVGVSGGGTAACGRRQLEVELTNPNYEFTRWTVAPASGLTIDCEPTSTTCTLTFGTVEGSATAADVTAAFTRKQCTVTGNALPVDIGGAVISGQTGGSVDANSSGRANDDVPCGDDVTLTPTANTDYTFTGWSGCSSVSGTTCTVTTSGLSQSAFVTATFTALTATAGDGEIELAWKAVTGAREYGVRTSTDGGTTWGLWQPGIAATATTHILTGLTNGTTYTLQMRVRSASGWSLPSGKVTATPRIKHELEATAGEGGSVICTVGVTSVDCDRAFLEGTVVTLKALAAPTYLFARWEFEKGSGCDSDSSEVTGHGTMAACDLEMSEAVEVAALFTRTYLLTVSDQEMGGSAACRLAGTEDSCPPRVTGGTMVSITAVADDGYLFEHWVIRTDESNGAHEATAETRTRNPLNMPVNADTTVTPVFEVDTAPEFAVATDSQTFQVGVLKSVHLPQATGGNGALTYSLDPVPAGLEFDSETAELARKATTTGTMVAGTTTAELEVHDADDNVADSDADTVTVTITVKPPDTAPMFAVETLMAPFTVNREGSVELPVASGGNGALTYTLSPEPSWLTLAVVDGVPTISGTPTTAGTTTAELEVHDADDNRADSDADTVSVSIEVVEVPQCTLVVKANPAAGGTVSDHWTGDCGTERTARVTGVTANYTFSGWSGGCSGTSRSCKVTVGTTGGPSTTVTVTANFTPPQCTLDVEAVPAAGGTVSGDWRGDCGTVRPARVTSVTANYTFGGWSGGGCSGTNRSCSVTVGTEGGPPTTVTVRASFTPPQCTLDVVADPSAGGQVSGDWTGACGTERTARVTGVTAGYRFSGWSDGGCSGTSRSCLVTVGNTGGVPTTVTVTASFAKQCTLTVQSSNTAWGTVSGGGTVDCDASTELTATAKPRTGYYVSAWSESGCSGNTCAVTMERSRTVRATFTPLTRTLTYAANPPAGGNVIAFATRSTRGDAEPRSTRSTLPFAHGTDVTLQATANTGYRLSGWTGADSSSGNTAYVTMNRDRGVSADFTSRCTLEVEADPTAGGTVSGGGTVDCGDTRTARVATVAANYRFSGWSGEGCSGTSRSCLVTVGTAGGSPTTVTVTASFTKQCTVTGVPSHAARGSVSGSDTVDCGEDVTLTATPSGVGWRVTGWSESSCSGETCTVTTSGTTPTRTVTANFGKRTCTVGVEVGTGSGTVGGGGPVQCGTSVNITASASANYCFGNWDGLLGISGTPRSTVCSESGDTSVEPTNSGVLTANFTRQSCKVTGSPSPPGGGTVEGGDTVSCGEDVTLTASAESDYRHSGWSGGGCSGTSSTCTVTTAGRWGVSIPTVRVNALFTRQYTLTVNGGTGSGTYDANTWVSISAPAAQCVLGFSLIFDRWSGDSTSTSRTTTIYMSRDKTVTATYTASATPCTLAASPDGDSDGPERSVADAAERPPLSLLVISDGATDALDLEWLGGPLNASGWQYRMRAAGADSWGDWTDMPASTGDTRAYRVSGLNGATGYRFQVRPVLGGVGSTPSNATDGATQDAGATHPRIAVHHIAEGDGETQWRLHDLAFVITIPDGMRLRAGEAGQTSVTAQDMGSGSYLTLSTAGAELGREVLADPVRNVGALFDQIIASVTASSSERETSDDQP